MKKVDREKKKPSWEFAELENYQNWEFGRPQKPAQLIDIWLRTAYGRLFLERISLRL